MPAANLANLIFTAGLRLVLGAVLTIYSHARWRCRRGRRPGGCLPLPRLRAGAPLRSWAEVGPVGRNTAPAAQRNRPNRADTGNVNF